MTTRVICRQILLVQPCRAFSCTGVRRDKHYPLVVLGGGAGGCSVAARAGKSLGAGKVAVVDAAKVGLFFKCRLILMAI